MMTRPLRLLGLTSLLTATAALSGCYAASTDSDNSGGSPGSGSTGNSGGSPGDGGGGGFIPPENTGGGINPHPPDSNAFPAAAFYDDASITEADTAVFTADGAFSGSLCVFEPHLSDAKGVGALYPMNWLRPRFRWVGAGGETLYEVRLRAAGQANDLVAYTRTTQWLMPQETWEAIAKGVQNVDITVIVRGASGGSLTGMEGTFRITPALAGGSMVFWGTESSVVAAGASRLYGFTMGDEAVVDTLATEQVTSIDRVYSSQGTDLRGEVAGENNDGTYIAGFEPGKNRCIGCHTATPDGAAMIFTDDYPWNLGISSVTAGTTGAAPDYVTPQARQFLKMPFLGTGTMLPSAFATGDRTLITTMGRRSDSTTPYLYVNYGYPWDDVGQSEPLFEPLQHDLIWIDLQTAVVIADTLPAATGDASGTPPWPVYYTGPERREAALARGEQILNAEGTAWGVLVSETGSITNPSASKNGLRIVYNVSESSVDGHPDWHNNTADIKYVDLASPRSGGTGMPLAGASDPSFLEYYPALSPDDAFVAFNRAPAPSNTTRCRENNPTVRTDPESAKCDNHTKDLGENPDGPYYNRKGEIFIVPAAGGTPHRLRGNDPVACGGEVSPGVLNSWPKWSSMVRTDDATGKKYYFVLFSSARAYPDQFELVPTEFTPPIENKSSQLYMSVIEHDPATGETISYAAIYLWNQNYLSIGGGAYEPLKTANLTPAWEDFTIPEVPPVVVVK